MLTVEKITVTKQKNIILKNVSLTVSQQEIMCIVGRNGAGKTTLLNSMLGLESLTNGTVLYNDVNMHTEDRYYALWNIGVMITNNSFYEYLTCQENLEIIKRYYGKTRFEVNEVLDLFDLTSIAKQKVNKLSSGMKQRLSLAIAFVNCPPLVILDEPFNSIDRENTRLIVKLIRRLNQEYNTAFIITSHSFDDIESLYSTLVVLKDGEIADSLNREAIEQLVFYKLNMFKTTISYEKIRAIFPNAIQDNNEVSFVANPELLSNEFMALEPAIQLQRSATAKDIYELIG